jgi:hypothetical protein
MQVLSTLAVLFKISQVTIVYYSVFILMYGALFGLLAGMTFLVPVMECNKYFPGKRTYVNGVILIGTGLGPAIFGMFSYHYLNPNKVSPIGGYYDG